MLIFVSFRLLPTLAAATNLLILCPNLSVMFY